MVNKLHIAPNGYCVHHSSIQLKRLRPRTGIWVTILNSCPLCEIDCEEGSEIDSSTNDVTGKTPSTSFTSPPPRHRRTLATTPKHPSQQQRLLQEASSVPSRLSSLTCLTEEEQQRLLLQEVSRALSFLQNRLSPSLRMTEEEGRDSKNKSHHENVYTRSNMPPLPPPPPPPSRSQAQDQDMSAPQPQMSQKKSFQLPPEEETSTKQTEKTPPMCQNFDLSPPPPRQHQRTSTDYGVTLASIPEEEEDTNEEQMLHDDLITQPLPQKSLQKKSPHPRASQEKTSQIQLQEKTLSTTTRKHEQSRSNEHPHKNKSKDARRSKSNSRRSSAPDGQCEMTSKIENKLRRNKSSALIRGGASVNSIASAPTKLGEVIGMEHHQHKQETLSVNGDDDAKTQPLPQKSLQKKSPHPSFQEKTSQIQLQEKTSSTTTRKHEQSRSNEHPHKNKSKDARRSRSSNRRSSAPDGQSEMTNKIENKLRRYKSSTLICGGASIYSIASAPTKLGEVIGMERPQDEKETLIVNGDDDAKIQPLPQKSLQKKSPHPRTSQEKTSQIQSEEKASSTTTRKHEQSRSNEHPHNKKSKDARRSKSSNRRSSAPDRQFEMTSKIENKLRRNKSSTLIRGGASVNSMASAPTKIEEVIGMEHHQHKQETLSVNGDDDAKTQPLPQKSLQKKSAHPRSQEKTSQIQSEEKTLSTTTRKHEQSRSNEHPHKSNDARRSRSSSRRSSAPDGQCEMTSKIENKLRRNKSSTLIRGGASVNSIASAPTKIDESLTVNVQQAKLTHNHGDSVQYSSMTHTDLVPHEHGLMVRDNRAKNDGKASKHGQRRQHRSQERKNRSSSSSSRRYESKSESIVNHCNTSEIVGSKYCHNDEAGSESRYSRSSSQTKELKNVVNEIYKSRHTANGDNISKQDNIIAFPIHMNGGGSKRRSKKRSSNNNSITHVKSSMATKDNLRRVANSNSMTPSTKFRQNWSSSCPKENWTVR